MSSENLITGRDILSACLLDCGEDGSVTGKYATDTKRFIREVYWAALARARWPFALSPTPGIITTVPKQDVTVLAISSATPAIVTLSAIITASQTGVKFYLASNQSVYRIAAHTGGTASLTLDAKYVETETAGPAVLYQDEYALPGTCLKVWDPLWPRGWQYDPIKLWDKPTFELRYGRGSWGLGFGRLEAACEVNPSAYSASDLGVVRRIRLAPWTEDAVNLEFDYAVFHDLDFTGSGDGDTPRIPREHRGVILYGANARLMNLKEDIKQAGAFAGLYENVLGSMLEQYVPQQQGALHVQMKHSAALGCN
jgi:hypothetical protein